MNLYAIDYAAISGASWLHRLPAGAKLVALVVIIGWLLPLELVPVAALVFVAELGVAVSARLPLRIFLAFTVYPLFFLALLFFSTGDLTPAAVLALLFRVLDITAATLCLFFSTSYTAIFAAISRIMPSFLVAALFYTYRSIFVIADSITDARTALHLRGGAGWRHPLVSLQNVGAAIGHFLVHAVDISQRMADGLTVRGFHNRVYFLERPR